MNGTIISEEKLLELKDLARKIEELKDLVQIIEDNSLPFESLSVEIQEWEMKQVQKAQNKINEIIKNL